MQIVRTILWVMLACAIMLFSFLNWTSVEVTLWDGLLVETKVPALVILAFLLGLIPMWLYHRSVKWGQSRRIRSLEASIKSAALARARETVSEEPVNKSVDNNEDKSGKNLKPVEDTPAGNAA
jgi:lipopolysaccharide assembly protein A